MTPRSSASLSAEKARGRLHHPVHLHQRREPEDNDAIQCIFISEESTRTTAPSCASSSPNRVNFCSTAWQEKMTGVVRDGDFPSCPVGLMDERSIFPRNAILTISMASAAGSEQLLRPWKRLHTVVYARGHQHTHIEGNDRIPSPGTSFGSAVALVLAY